MERMRNDPQSGSALVAVLCLIFTAGLLTTLVMALAKSGSFTVSAHGDLQRSMLISEGVAARVQWLLAADRNLYSTRDPGKTVYEEYDYDRYLADGITHELDYHGTPVRFTITDVQSGMDFSTASAAADSLASISSRLDEDDELIEKIETLQGRVADYMDSDSDPAENEGMEADDYEGQDMAPLPRNAVPQFREELLWIPGFRDVIPVDRFGRLSGVRLIPAEGSGTIPSGSPSLLTADEKMLRTYTDFEDDEIEQVMDALKLWRREKTPIEETLDETLVSRLNGFSRSESGYYTIRIEGGAKQPFRRLIFSVQGMNVSGPSGGVLRYMEWMFL